MVLFPPYFVNRVSLHFLMRMLTFILERKLHKRTILGAVKNKKKMNRQTLMIQLTNKTVFKNTS